MGKYPLKDTPRPEYDREREELVPEYEIKDETIVIKYAVKEADRNEK